MSSRGPEEGLTWSTEREPSAHSPDDEEEEDYEADRGEDGEKVEEGEGGEEKEDEEEESDEGSHEESDESIDQMDRRGSRPFILLKIWTVNNFYPTMSQRVCNTLRDCHQISDNIPIRLPSKFERCYSGKTTDVEMYDAMFTAGLRLLLMELHHQLANYLGLSINQIAPNTWRIFIGAEVIWGQLSGGNRRLTLDEFFYYYRPQQISSSKGIYHFLVRKSPLRLVSDMLDSNRN